MRAGLWARLTRDAADDGDEEEHAVAYFGEPISSGYVLIERDYLANVTSLEHERWKRAPFIKRACSRPPSE